MKLLDGISSKTVKTSRLSVHYFERKSGTNGADPVLLVHGNVSSGAFWQEIMQDLPKMYDVYAPDLRGYGETEALPIDATLGLDDMVQDLISFADSMGLESFHVAGHSMGGGIIMKLAIAIPKRIKSLILVDPMSPYGFAGSKDIQGTPCYDDGAPAGAGGVSPDFVRLVAEKYTDAEEQMAPINVLRAFYVKPPFIAENEDMFLESMLTTKTGEDWYPGDVSPSENWPGAKPGTRGVANAFARKYFDASGIRDISPKPPILWIRGADDAIVSNNSMFDIQALGAMGAVPGWPGAEVCPPQPMIDQTRAVLTDYATKGGSFKESVIADSGHSPFIDQKDEFENILFDFLKSI